jgi:hypothetical protein
LYCYINWGKITSVIEPISIIINDLANKHYILEVINFPKIFFEVGWGEQLEQLWHQIGVVELQSSYVALLTTQTIFRTNYNNPVSLHIYTLLFNQ